MRLTDCDLFNFFAGFADWTSIIYASPYSTTAPGVAGVEWWLSSVFGENVSSGLMVVESCWETMIVSVKVHGLAFRTIYHLHFSEDHLRQVVTVF